MSFSERFRPLLPDCLGGVGCLPLCRRVWLCEALLAASLGVAQPFGTRRVLAPWGIENTVFAKFAGAVAAMLAGRKRRGGVKGNGFA